ncbi:transcription factor AP-2 [Cooperia oncophora]
MLRDRLAEKGVSLPSGRRKTAPTTSFTALCEREALVMARDFNTLCMNSLNTFEIARHSNRLQYTPQELAIVRRFLAGIMAIFDEVPEDPEDYVEKNSATHSINIFSMLGNHRIRQISSEIVGRVLGKIATNTSCFSGYGHHASHKLHAVPHATIFIE